MKDAALPGRLSPVLTAGERRHYLDVAVRAARAAGDVVRDRFGSAVEVDFKGSAVDLVTEVDRRAEDAAAAVLRRETPGLDLLSEEAGLVAGADGAAGAGNLHWVLDPLDGTTNFVHSLPFVCVSLALCADGQPVVGVILDPLRGSLYTAAAGEGAARDGRPVGVSGRRHLLEAVVATGWAAGRHGEYDRILGDVCRVTPRTRNVRALGSAALHLAYVADGRLDGFWERRLNPWDVAAGVLLVREAGGTVTDREGRPFRLDSPTIVATNGLLHEALLGLLADGDANPGLQAPPAGGGA